MKTKTYVARLDRDGEIRLSDYFKILGLDPGEEVAVKVTDKRLLLEPVEEAVPHKKKKNGHPETTTATHSMKQLIGILELDDPEVEELITREDWYD